MFGNPVALYGVTLLREPQKILQPLRATPGNRQPLRGRGVRRGAQALAHSRRLRPGPRSARPADALIHLLGINCLETAITCLGATPEDCRFMPSVLRRIRCHTGL